MVRDAAALLTLAEPEAARLQALVREYCGLRVEGYKLAYALAAAWPTLRGLGIAEPSALIRELTSAASRLWPVLVPFLTVNETYFRREPRQLEDFLALALPGLRARALARGDLALAVLSAACASGEEAVTLAVLLAQARAAGRVTGIDLDPVVLAKAEAATYGPNAFRAVDAAWRDAHFVPAGAARWAVRPEVRARVTYQRANLLQVEAQLAGRRFDAIFCRNVLIYFDRPTQLEVIHQLRRMLHPGGVLCLGHSEMFFGVDLGLAVIQAPGSTMYRRGEHG